MKIETDSHFQDFRDNIVGIDLTLDTPFGETGPLTYLDWTASGRGYHPVEKSVLELLGHYANTHSESSFVGRYTSERYHDAHRKVREHVNADPGDVALFKGQGATGGVNWLQYMLGLRQPIPHENQPIVFITHMEHHSNQTSWEECSAQVIIVKADGQGRPDLNDLSSLCKKYRSEGRQLYGAFTACSNVTGITTNYHEMARILHENEGWCFIDFAASAPYVDINMHPADPLQALDAVYFSPHKFLGGPGSSGVIVFNSALYRASVPVEVGGGIVRWTNPWGLINFMMR